MIKEIFLYNAEECTYWIVDSTSDFLNAFLIIITEDDPVLSTQSFTYSFHKMPIAYYSCMVLFDDYSLIIEFYDNIIAKSTKEWGNYGVKLVWNVLFNLDDIIYES